MTLQETLKCVDCGKAGLVAEGSGSACPACGRKYPTEDGIHLMLPKALEEMRLTEMAARDKNAPQYDEQRPADYCHLVDHFSIESMAIGKDSVVMDAGCGTGRTCVKLGFKAKEIVAWDFSLASLKIAKTKYEASGAPAKITFIQADANCIPLAGENRFDFINAVEFIQHVPSFSGREKMVKDFRTFLKPGGKAAITAYHYGLNKQEGETIRKQPLPGEGGKQGFHRGGVFYYNFALPEAEALFAQAGFTVSASGLFYFAPPRFWMRVKRLLGLDRPRFEARFYDRLKGYADRLYVHGVK